MDNQNDKKKKDNETRKLWDAIFTSGLLSFFKDSQEAGNDQKNSISCSYKLYSVLFLPSFCLRLVFGYFWTKAIFVN
ncbi:hypothetical protein NST02_09015 [Robertmurraya sp. FSL W8-0741]|uniref:hypothetical protein n=1 Tax=Robertmurraya sp. FSL W8-0741 TaxID=2954629 RepID=UPI0030F5EAC9